MTIVNRVRGALLLVCLLATAYIGAVHLILPAAVLLLPVPIPAARTAYRCIVDGVALSWFTLAAALLETLGGVEIVATGDAGPVAADERFSLVLANHHCRLDWMFLWCLVARQRTAGRLKIALKAGLRAAPAFGWAMQAFLFVFLSRANREHDLSRLSRLLEHCVKRRDALTFLLFPEGTDLSPSNVALSHAHAAKSGLARLDHVLVPRAAGFARCRAALGSSLDCVYDATLAYTPHPEEATLEDPRPSEGSLLRGTLPRRVDIHVERVPAAALPAADDESALKKWLLQRWSAKEAALAKRGAAAPSSGVAAPRVAYAVALAGWAVLCALVCRALWTSPTARVLTVGGGAALMAVTRFAGGLDGLELETFAA